MGLPGFTTDLAVFPQKRICTSSYAYCIRSRMTLHAITAIITAYFLGVGGYVYTLSAWTSGFQSIYWPASGDVDIL